MTRSLENVRSRVTAPCCSGCSPVNIDVCDGSVQTEGARALRTDAAKGIEHKILQYYDRILRGRAPNVLYPLTAGACGNCHTAVPLHRRQQIENGQAVEACEACGVLVYMGPAE